MIQKTASDPKQFFQHVFYYRSARDAFSRILKSLPADTTVLLPAYIGFSEREGSGVFDPVADSGLAYSFYGMDRNLEIDLDSLQEQCRMHENRGLVLLIHYFGYVDRQFQKAKEIACAHGCRIVEDCAHAFFTALEDGLCGEECSIFSLHKMFPFSDGGMLLLREGDRQFQPESFRSEVEAYPLLSYRLREIADRRKENAHMWAECLKDCPEVTVLRSEERYPGQTPQTFPILLKKFDRNEFYFEMNRRGYGVVSLYHTMIAPIQEGNWVDSQFVAAHITNLPVHQDVTPVQIQEMYKVMKEIFERG